jgi:glutathione S-transferase
MIKLFHNDMSVCAQKVRFVLEYKSIDWTSEHLNLRNGDQFKPAFRQINPKGLIPVLMHEDAIITESNTIVEYIEEVFPQNALMPKDPVLKAHIRYWMGQLDTGLHEHIAIISFCLAFRFQILERYKTEDALTGFLAKISDPSRASVMKETITKGLQSERLSAALYAYRKLLDEMDKTLNNSSYLVGSDMTLADVSILPYIERLTHLQLSFMWDNKPSISRWYKLMRSNTAYKQSIVNWYNQDYIKLMSVKAELKISDIKEKIDAMRNL